MKLTYIVKEEKKVKEVIKKFNFSKRFLKKLRDNKRIYLNDKFVYLDELLHNGDMVCVDIDFEEKCENIISTDIPLDIVFEDNAYLIINKEAGIETHPTYANFANTLANGVKYYFEKNNINKKIRPVNRLDKDTSGLIIFAKSEYVQEQLVKQMKDNKLIKEYYAIVEGQINKKKDTINASIKRAEGSILERCVDEAGDIAITEYEVIGEYKNMTLVKCVLKTGRTHQIRVHMKHIGNPIVGDFLYGIRDNRINRQALHSYKLEFIHPITNENVKYKVSLPKDMKSLLMIM